VLVCVGTAISIDRFPLKDVLPNVQNIPQAVICQSLTKGEVTMLVITQLPTTLNYFSSMYLLRHLGRVIAQSSASHFGGLDPISGQSLCGICGGKIDNEIQVSFGVLRLFPFSTILQRSVLVHSPTTMPPPTPTPAF
jgi:hypothetical protein